MWYCASILKIAERNGQRDSNSLWEEQFLLISATDEEAAMHEAEHLARQDKAPYSNRHGQVVSWKFVTMERIYQIAGSPLEHGTELFSRFLRDSEAKSLMTPFTDNDTTQ